MKKIVSTFFFLAAKAERFYGWVGVFLKNHLLDVSRGNLGRCVLEEPSIGRFPWQLELRLWSLFIVNSEYALRDLVTFVQFKKCEKHPWRSVKCYRLKLSLSDVSKEYRNKTA